MYGMAPITFWRRIAQPEDITVSSYESLVSEFLQVDMYQFPTV